GMLCHVGSTWRMGRPTYVADGDIRPGYSMQYPPNCSWMDALRVLAVAFEGSDGLAPEPPAGHLAWLDNDVLACRALPWRGSKEVRPLTSPKLGTPATDPRRSSSGKGQLMAAVMIGVDPHKGSHTAVAIGAAEELLGQVRVRAGTAQARQLLAWAAPWPERAWAVEGAGGLGHLLAQQLVAAGERVLDVPPKLA